MEHITLETLGALVLGIVLFVAILVAGKALWLNDWRMARKLAWYARVGVVSAVKHFFVVRIPRYDDYVGERNDPRNRSGSSGKVHSEALEGTSERAGMDASEGMGMTKEEWIVCLANSELFDDEGNAAPFSKAKIAAFVGMRAEDAGRLIDMARGVELREKPPTPRTDPRFPELTANGRGVSAALKGK